MKGPYSDQVLSRRGVLRAGAAALGGAVLLDACGSPASSSGAAPAASRPPIGKEPGKLSMLEWSGYEAAGTKAQTAGMTVAGKSYISKYGADSVAYTYITDDDQGLAKATSGGPFDLLHPCHENLQDYVNRGLVQPIDTKLLPSFSQLNPYLVQMGQVNGKQYMIPWDWGYGSLIYRTDKIAAADATGWELAWNKKYQGKISLWSGASTNFEIAALKLGFGKPDNLTDSQLQACKQSLLEQKPMNKFYWSGEYSQMQPGIKSGTIWAAYAWQDTLVTMTSEKIPVAYMDPSQGRLSWLCGFMVGAKTQNWYHAHEYIESFINHDACVQMTNAFSYGTSNAAIQPSEITNKTLAAALRLSDPHALMASNVHMQGWAPNRAQIEQAWQEIQAA